MTTPTATAKARRARANVRIKIPKLHRAQRKVKESARRYNSVVCGRRWGKTILGMDIVREPALAGYPVAYFAPTYKMLAETWRQMRNQLEPAAKRISEQEHSIRLIGDGLIDMWSLEHADAPRGRRYAVIVVDEAAMIRNLMETWDNVLRPTLSDYRGSAWFLSTPKGENTDFHTLYKRGLDGGRWASWQMPTSTNPYIHPDEIADARADMGEVAFRQEYMAEFVADVSAYIPLDVWDGLYDPDIAPLLPGDRTPMVLAVDAAVSGDCFAMVPITRHPDPQRHNEVIVHPPRIWRPADFPDRRINFHVCEDAIRWVCRGGCPAGHPRGRPDPECQACERGEIAPGYNVVQIAYDPYQLEGMMQGLQRDRVAWCKPYGQGQERLIGDSLMHKLALRGELHHTNSPGLREHIINAHATMEADKDSRMRIVKKEPESKVDAVVAAAMGVKRCLDLNI